MSLVAANARLDRAEWLEKIRQGVWRLGGAPSDICADREIVLAAVTENGWALKFASAEMQADRKFVLAATVSRERS